MVSYDAVLKVDDLDTAWAHSRGRICAVVLDGTHIQVGQARDFRRLHGKFICTIDCDEEQWHHFAEQSQEGALLVAGGYCVVGPLEK